jgi:hypothetical protein
MGVNHVNLSTDVENSVTNKMPPVLSVPIRIAQGPGKLPSERANAQMDASSLAVHFFANTITRVSYPVP